MGKKAGKKAKKAGTLAIDVACPQCEAAPGKVCSNYKGATCAPHSARNAAASGKNPKRPRYDPKSPLPPVPGVAVPKASKPDTRVISREHNRPRVEVKIAEEQRAFIVRAIEKHAKASCERPSAIGPWLLTAALAAASLILDEDAPATLDKEPASV